MTRGTIAILTGILVLVLLETRASAGTFYFDPPLDTVGSWETVENWRVSCGGLAAGGLPTALDNVIICSGQRCNLASTRKVMFVTVDSTASLYVNSGGVLQLENAANATSTVNGSIQLVGKIEVSFTDDACADCCKEHVFAGNGYIYGNDAGAEIRVEGKSTPCPHELVNSTHISGQMTIARLDDDDISVFTMQNGLVESNSGGTLKIALSGLDDRAGTGDSLFKVSAGSILVVDFECGGGAGPCVNSCLEYTEVLITEGTFRPIEHFTTEKHVTIHPGGMFDGPAGYHISAPTNTCAP